jgi:tetratricopeptide (TPR) repeat protein
MGNVLVDEGKLEEATKYYRLAIEQGRLYNSSSIIAENYQRIAKAFYRNGQIDSSFSYAKQAFILATELKNPFIKGDVSGLW